MLKIEDILREDFDWENVEIDENEFDELENQLIINYLKKNSPKERQLLAIDWNFDNSKEVINGVVILCDIILNLQHTFSGAGEINRSSSGLGAFDSLRMVMGHLGHRFGEGFCLFKRPCRIPAAAYPHGGAVSKAVVRLRMIGIHPPVKRSTIAAVRIRAANLLHGADCLLSQTGKIRSAAHQRVAYGQ